MEFCDFEDCGVHLESRLEKYERKLNQQPPWTPASRTQASARRKARKLARQTPSLSVRKRQLLAEQKAHEEKEKQHAETSKKLEEVRELLLASAKKQEQMQDMLTNLEDRLGLLERCM